MTGGKRIVIIAGPNGAGKTTFAREYLPNEADCPIFVNADLIASGLSPFAPGASALRAGRLMLEEINGHVRAGRSFAFDLRLASVDLALARVAARVRQGGHDVPAEVIERRFGASWRNFQRVYKPLVDAWVLYDNSAETPTLTEQEIRR